MKSLPLVLVSAIFSFSTFAAEESPADAKIRADIPLGGGLKPNPKGPAFVVVGHGDVEAGLLRRPWSRSRPVGHEIRHLHQRRFRRAGGLGRTDDLSKTFTTFGMWGTFKDDGRGYKLSTHHIGAVYCGDESGRFLALGDNRGESGPKFDHLFASDDLGKTWKWLAPKGRDASTGRGTFDEQ